MYADDLVLLSSSVSELQEMIYICCGELSKLDLNLNESKSVCIRIGKRFHATCAPLHTLKGDIAWASSATYLGVNIASAANFSCCFDKAKAKFYASFNSIYGKLGKINDPMVTLKLVSSMALPCLLYATEALPLSKTIFRSLEHPWSRVFMKMFTTFDAKTVLACQFYTGFMPVQHLASVRKIKFINSLAHSSHWLMRALHDLVGNDELRPLASLYGVSVTNISINSRDIIRLSFENCIN
jgi:hypothetical protein